MARPESERTSVLDEAGDLARRAWSDDVPRGHAAIERERFRLALRRQPQTRQRSRVFVLVAAAAAALCMLGGALFFFVERRLDYVVESSAGAEDGYLDAAPDRGAAAHFSDGTEVAVARGGRARIVEVDGHGARIALEHGRANLRVVHRAGARWSVDAGPFSIAVTGTQFDVAWQGSAGELAVDLHVGSVIVKGPLAESGIALRAGQRLVANLAERKLHIEEIRGDSPAKTADKSEAAAPRPEAPVAVTETATTATEEPATEEPPANERTTTRSSVAPAPANGTGEGRSWSARVASGDFASVLGDADARGVDATLAKAPLSDLVALSDAARYKGRTDLARRALTAIRARFPASADSRNALFHLGRLAEGRGALPDALASYDRYLSEARNGTFAAEAFGRKLVVTRKVAGDETARSVARDYLARFPGGSYAGTAKELLGSR